ncbi:hypothetical protein B0H99_107168 [Planomicrobium soli]|uniref:Uncharacterized protein n=1 Tax=Planomicrobium soli TaxID=1176648 RepID=A0A2P8GQW3_9BACL|nr:hypothetical protein [Planomicrobium soli]PSL36347.1 hypothetical protein B0H99_107168 [Planomicrobium soli]
MALNWLQGGPFLEVSFLCEFREERKEIIQSLASKLSDLAIPVNIVDPNIEELIAAFEAGYLYDESDPNSLIIHSLEFKLEADISGKRKAILHAEQLSSNTLLVDFRFFGSQFDAPEWNQSGIKNEDLPCFIDFLITLYEKFEFIAGGIALDEDVRELFDCMETTPSECYRFEKLSAPAILHSQKKFLALVWNENYQKLQDTPPFLKRIGKSGVLATPSASYSEF